MHPIARRGRRALLPAVVAGLVGGLIVLCGLWLRPVGTPVHAAADPAAEAWRLQTAGLSFAPAVRRSAPGVVNIFTTQIITRGYHPFLDDPLFRRFFGAPRAPYRGQQSNLGSGVVVSDQGHVMTNHHVVREADEIEVALADGRTAGAAVVGVDRDTDLAVLRIQLPELPSVAFGDSERLEVGDLVFAIGNPFGVGQTVTMGIVGALGRQHLGINNFEDFIQTDAAINPGNSGGALIDASGRLVGINTAIYSRTGASHGIGFAVPVHVAQKVLDAIVRDGRVIRGWLGIEVQDITPALAESFDLPRMSGVIVAGVYRGTPAFAAGLKPGDVIVEIDGVPTRDANQALRQISDLQPGSTTQLLILRGERVDTLPLQVAARPQQRR